MTYAVMTNQHNYQKILRAKHLHASDLSREALCLKVANAEQKAGALAALIAEATIEWVPEKYQPLLDTIQSVRSKQEGGL